MALRELTGRVIGAVGTWLQVDLDDPGYRRRTLFVPRVLEHVGGSPR